MPPSGGSSETTQRRVFTPEATEVLRREIPAFLQISPLLGSLQQSALAQNPQGVQQAASSARSATAGAGEAADLDMSAMADVLQTLDPANPEFMNILRLLGQSVATSAPSIVEIGRAHV